MRKLLADIFCVAFVLCMVACSEGDDDGDVYIPPYVTDLVVASTDANGKVLKVCLDDGATYNVASQQVNLEKDVSLLPRDPMKVISMWKSGGYLNMHLGLMTTDNGAHQFAFCEDSTGHFSLLHQRPASDGSAYTENVYMSMPLPQGLDQFTFTVKTYDGNYTRTF